MTKRIEEEPFGDKRYYKNLTTKRIEGDYHIEENKFDPKEFRREPIIQESSIVLPKLDAALQEFLEQLKAERKLETSLALASISASLSGLSAAKVHEIVDRVFGTYKPFEAKIINKDIK